MSSLLSITLQGTHLFRRVIFVSLRSVIAGIIWYTLFLKTNRQNPGEKGNETPKIAEKTLNECPGREFIDFINSQRNCDLEIINNHCSKTLLLKMWSTWELGRNAEYSGPTPDLRNQNLHWNKIRTQRKLKKQYSKQLAKSEGLFLFVLKTAFEPRVIFTFLKPWLKKKRFFYRDCLRPYPKNKNKNKKKPKTKKPVCHSLCSAEEN